MDTPLYIVVVDGFVHPNLVTLDEANRSMKYGDDYHPDLEVRIIPVDAAIAAFDATR